MYDFKTLIVPFIKSSELIYNIKKFPFIPKDTFVKISDGFYVAIFQHEPKVAHSIVLAIKKTKE